MIKVCLYGRKKMSKELAARIDAAIRASKFTKAEIARMFQVTPQAVNGWVKTGSISKQTLIELAGILGTTANKLLFGYDSPGSEVGEGKGEMSLFLTDEEKEKLDKIAKSKGLTFEEAAQYVFDMAIVDIQKKNNQIKKMETEMVGRIDSWDESTPLEDDEVEVPFFMEVELAAGIGGELANETKGPKLRFAKSTLRRCGVDPEAAACVKVSGNSMEPRLHDGDVVGVNTLDKKIVDGKTYAINHDGLLRVKRLYRLPGGGIRINSMNTTEYPDEHYDAEEAQHITVIGRVFWHSSIW